MERCQRNPCALPLGKMANILINCLPPEPFCLCPTHRVMSQNMGKRKNNLTICHQPCNITQAFESQLKFPNIPWPADIHVVFTKLKRGVFLTGFFPWQFKGHFSTCVPLRSKAEPFLWSESLNIQYCDVQNTVMGEQNMKVMGEKSISLCKKWAVHAFMGLLLGMVKAI